MTNTDTLDQLQQMLVDVAQAHGAGDFGDDAGAWFYLPGSTLVCVATAVASAAIKELDEEEAEPWKPPTVDPHDRAANAHLLRMFFEVLQRSHYSDCCEPLADAGRRLDASAFDDIRFAHTLTLPAKVAAGFIDFMRWFATTARAAGLGAQDVIRALDTPGAEDAPKRSPGGPA
jgi:hypothetical protein